MPPLVLVDGDKAQLWGTGGVLAYTRIWLLGPTGNIRHVFFAIHGDAASDYSSATATDRANLAAALPAGVGAVVAYPIATGQSWPAFQGATLQRANDLAILRMYRQIEQAAGQPGIDFQTFSLSGGGRFDHALLRLVVDKYGADDTGLGVEEFVDDHLRGMHCGESLSYDLTGSDGLVAHWIEVLQAHAKVHWSFIDNPNSTQFAYMVTYANDIVKALGGPSFAAGDVGAFGGGRVRWWAGDSHFDTWRGQFERAFLE